MGKKNLTKSEHQKNALEEYYAVSKGQWSREELEVLAEEIGLSRQQIYKWLWDKKSGEKRKIKSQDEDQEEGDPQMYEFDYNRYSIKVPTNLSQAIEFRVQPGISIWAIDILKKEGWQLVLENSPYSLELLDSNEMPLAKKQYVRKGMDREMMEIEEYQPIMKLNKFQMVNEEIEDFPFLKKKNQELQVKEEFVEEGDLGCLSFKKYMEGKERGELKVNFGTMNLGVHSEKGSLDEVFQSKQ